MNLEEEVSLAKYSTMALGGPAKYLVEVNSKEDLQKAVAWAKKEDLPQIMIGSGSNIIWQDKGFAGLVIVNCIKGFELESFGDGELLKVGAGEIWDAVVGRTVDRGLSGIEGMSLIPGKTGATPVQNVGAYGQEISDTLISLEAYDTQTDEFVTLNNDECDFSYRSSRFKTTNKGRYLITSLKLKLNHGQIKRPFYPTLETFLNKNNINDYSPASIRQAVINIRQSKLPDPAVIHNTGSFFGNPIISIDQLADLQTQYEHVPSWPVGENEVKISAAWLIEHAGYKDTHDSITGMATWKNQSLVLVNESAKSTADLLAFKQEIVGTIEDKFKIRLIQEPELLP